jgi:hypothetical protein
MRRKNRQPDIAVTSQGWLDRRLTKLVNSNRWASFAWLLVIATAGGLVYLFAFPAPEPAARAVPAATPTTESSTSMPTPVQVSGCAAADPVPVPPEALVLTTFDTTWSPVGQSQAPSSPAAGPLIAAPFASCFARTPEGSLYAIASFVAEASEAPQNAERLALVHARVSRAGNYDKLVESLSRPGETTGQPLSKVSGYRWVQWSPEAAVVELQFTVLTGDLAGKQTSTVFQAVWQDNDWLVVVPNEGDQIHQAGTNLRTFTTWGS